MFYIDERTPGKGFDEFYRRAVEQYDVDYIKGMVGKVSVEGDHLNVQGSDLLYERAGAYQRRYGRSCDGNRAGSQRRARSARC